MRDKFKKRDMWAEYKFWRNRTKQILDEAKQNFYNNMLKESKNPKIIWKCIHSLNPSNHIRPHRLVTQNDIKVDNSIYIANTFRKFFLLLVLKILEVKICQLPLILVKYITLLIIKYLKIHNLLYPQ
jgi:hypothetical protein